MRGEVLEVLGVQGERDASFFFLPIDMGTAIPKDIGKDNIKKKTTLIF